MAPDKKIPATHPVVVSAVRPDGTLIETVYSAVQRTTGLVLARGGDIQIVPSWEDDGRRFSPIHPDNNLLKHRALLLPSEPSDFDDLPSLIADVDRYTRSYVSLPARHLQIAVAFVLLSWVYDAFNELPYLRFRGDYGTGKTRALLVIGSLCYKAFFASGASTVAPIFHTLDAFRGTLVLDEADFRFTDEKAELVKILNNGNAKGFPVLRMQVNTKKEFDPRAFRVFGPKIVAMRSSYDDRALESRFITIDMQPGQSEDVPINLPDRQRDEALELRNKLLMFRLRYRHQIALDPSLVDGSLEARTNQILLPLLSVAPTAEMRSAILSAARNFHAGILTERADSTEGHVLSVVKRLPADRDEPLRVAEIAVAFAQAFGSEYEQPVTNRWVGKILRRLGLALYKRNGVSVLVPGQGQRLAALFARYGLDGGQ
jgi:hypothetical protein